MYLARFESRERGWLQTAIQLLDVRERDGQAEHDWWATFEGLVRGMSPESEWASAVRLTLTTDGLSRRLFVMAPAHEEQALRRYVAAFTRLNTLVDESVAIATQREEHDRLVDGFPRFRCQVVLPPYSAGDAWLACDFRVSAALGELMLEAAARGFEFAYQVHLQPYSVDPASLREARLNALRVEAVAGAPRALVELQQRLAVTLLRTSAVCEELLGISSAEGVEWLREALEQRFLRAFSSLKLPIPEFDFVELGHGDALTAARHRVWFDRLAVDELCAAAIDDEARTTLLGWRPPCQLVRQRSRPAASPPVSVPQERVPGRVPTLVPLPHEGPEDYIFVSYKREDLPRIAPALRHLARSGYRCWYDKGIPGGAEWDALIEEKIERCRLLLLFVSRASIQSRYVRREVKFADALNKPVLGIRLEDAELSHGMKMFLTQYQMIDVSAHDFTAELDRAVKHVRLL